MLKTSRNLTLACAGAVALAVGLPLINHDDLQAQEAQQPPQPSGQQLAKLEQNEIAGAAAAAATAAVEELNNQGQNTPPEATPHADAAAAAAAALAQDPNNPMLAPEQPVPVEFTDEMKKLAQDRMKLELQYALRLQELRNQLSDLEVERQKLDAEMLLANTRQASELLKIEQERRKLQGETVIAKEKITQETALITAEKEREDAKLALEKQKVTQQLATLEAETAKITAEKARLAAQQELAAAANQAKVAEITAQKDQIEADLALSQAKMQKELETMRQEKERMGEEIAALEQRVTLAEARAKESVITGQLANNDEYKQYIADKRLFDARNEARTAEMSAMDTEAKLRQANVAAETTLMGQQISREEQRKTYEEFVYQDIEYRKEPFENGILYITDRRVPMNDVITMDTADYVTSMIDYFNNKSAEYPIFIVIDDCPGGSVMAGYRILKSMQGSKAPVYVVVKSYAASMAATICTMAPRSYVYPNAIIHHHQMLYGSQGNMTQQADALKEANKWWGRLAGPVAEKMGITLEEFTSRMYKQNADGEWAEFGTDAVKLKWADTVTEEIREVGTSKMPDQAVAPVFPWFALKEQKDASGASYKTLPRLGRMDAWYLSNKDGYYRFQ